VRRFFLVESSLLAAATHATLLTKDNTAKFTDLFSTTLHGKVEKRGAIHVLRRFALKRL
jgi:hypothetical protein